MRRRFWILGAALALTALQAQGQNRPGAGPQTTIMATESPAGYVVVRAKGTPPNPAQAAVLIGDSMERWLIANNRKVRAVTGIVSGGNTVAVYLWPEPPLQQPKAPRRVSRR